jgi:6-pyruvoyltetrahydropterin/6-carboxytetrahydropterin synthase
VRLRRSFSFEAAHHLPRHPGKCRQVHGHSFRLTVTLEGTPEPASGMLLDFAQLKRVVRGEVLERLDHTDLNQLIDNPTAENLCRWIWERLTAALPGLCEIELHETANCSVVYRGE